MKPVIIIAIAFVLLIPIPVFAESSEYISLYEKFEDAKLKIEIEEGIRTQNFTLNQLSFLIPLDKIKGSGSPKDGIPSIDNPKFIQANSIDYLLNDDLIIGVNINGQQKAYPLSILVWHQLVNDNLGDNPVLITFDPLTFSVRVFERTLDNTEVEFGVTGKLFNSNMLMYDRFTESYWSQSLGIVIKGDMIWNELEKIPFDIMTWNDWKTLYPNSLVLTTETGVIRSYDTDPYGDYYVDDRIMFPLESTDSSEHSKTKLISYSQNGFFKAIKQSDIQKNKIINDNLGKYPVLLISFFDENVRGFERILDGQTLEFEESNSKLVDLETNSVWNYDGKAISGELEGQQLKRIPLDVDFWFEWVASHPNFTINTLSESEKYDSSNIKPATFDYYYSDGTILDELIFDVFRAQITELEKIIESERQQEEYERIVPETVIINPKDVQNSEFYNINTECQLKYFFYKDPAKTAEIYSLIVQNQNRVEQEYFERAGYTQNPDVMREIITEITMEHYSINPILKDNVTIISAEELPQKEIQQIQQGTHPCEEEFSLYPLDKDPRSLEFTTRTPFDDTPINGAEIGQWVKHQFEISTSSDENMRDLMIKQFSKSLDGANFDLDDVEWLKREVIDISGNKITIQDEYKVKGKTSLFTKTLTYDFPDYGISARFIPTNVEKGNILFRDSVFGDITVVDFPKKNYGGKNIDTIHVMASNEYNQAGESVKNYIENYYDKKTGILLDGKLSIQVVSVSKSFDIDFQIKAIDFHTPSSNAVGGGGCLIATATFGSELAPQVQQLRELRDNSLLQTESGTAFMNSFNDFYYSFSPYIADYERENPIFREAVKIVITPMISSLSILNNVEMDSEVEVLRYGISLILLNIGMYFVAPVIVIVEVSRKHKHKNSII